ncbi:MAG: hypothetical protein V4720_13280 [Pseudomonadota bacterium]
MQRIFLLSIACFSAGTALALDADQCPVERHPDSLVDGPMPPRDLGDQVVMQVSYGAISWDDDSAIKFTDCASGETLRTLSRWWMPMGLPSDRPEETAFKVMGEMIARSKDQAFEKAVEAGAVTGDAVVISNDGQETCGCAAFYPELRGDKRPWVEM